MGIRPFLPPGRTAKFSAGPAIAALKGGPWISTDAALTGPGGLSFFDHDGVTVAALHSWNAGVTFDEGGFRQLAVASVDWS